MHEVGLMHEALRIALEHAARNDAACIHAVALRVGQLAGVDLEALRLAFQVVTIDTLAQGAALQLEELPVECWCGSCEQRFCPAGRVYRCPRCHRVSVDIRQGREFDVVRVEIS